MILPRPVVGGQPIRADDFNRLLAYVESLNVRAGPSLVANRSTRGTTLNIKSKPVLGTVGAFNIIHPFKITDASDAMHAKVDIQFGKLNNITPTLNDNVTGLSTQTTLALTPAATTGTWVIFLEVKIVDDESATFPDYDHIWVVAQKSWTEAGNGDDPELYGYQIIAEVDVVAGTPADDEADPPVPATPDKVIAIRQNVTHGLKYQLCGRQVADEEASPPIAFNPGYPVFWGI